MLTQYQYTQVYRILAGLLMQPQVMQQYGQQVCQTLMQMFDPMQGTPDAQNALSSYMSRAVPMEQWQGPQGVNAQVLQHHLINALPTWVNNVMQPPMQAQNPMMVGGYGGGMTQPAYGNMSPFATPNANQGFPQRLPAMDAGLSGHATTAQPAMPPSDIQSNAFIQPQAAAAFANAAAEKEQPAMAPAADQSFADLIEDVILTDADEHDVLVPGKRFGLHTDHYRSGTASTGMKLTNIVMSQMRPMNHPFDVFRNVWRAIKNDLPVGEFSITVNYDQLSVVRVPTLHFLEVWEELFGNDAAPFKVTKAIEILGGLSRGEWTQMEELLVKQINTRMSKYGRESDRPSRWFSISTLDEINEFLRFPEKFFTHPDFLNRLTHDVLQPAFAYALGDKKPHSGRNGIVIDETDKYLADLFAADGIELALEHHEDLDKYNALRKLPAEDLTAVVRGILDEATVIRVPSHIVIQNVITGEGLVGPKKVDHRLFGTLADDGGLIANDLVTANMVYGVRKGNDPVDYLTQFTPIRTLDNALFFEPISGNAGLI